MSAYIFGQWIRTLGEPWVSIAIWAGILSAVCIVGKLTWLWFDPKTYHPRGSWFWRLPPSWTSRSWPRPEP